MRHLLAQTYDVLVTQVAEQLDLQDETNGALYRALHSDCNACPSAELCDDAQVTH